MNVTPLSRRGGHHAVEGFQGKGHRFFAQHVATEPRRLHDVLLVQVGGGADVDDVGAHAGHRLFSPDSRRAELLREFLRVFRVRVDEAASRTSGSA